MTTTLTDVLKTFFVFVQDKNTGKITRVAAPSDLQVGLVGNPSSLELFGSLSLAANEFQVTNSNEPVKLSNHDTVATIEVSSGSSVTVYLPTRPKKGQVHFIKDGSGTASSIDFTITTTTGALIDGEESQLITSDFGSIAVYWAKGSWHVLVSGGGGSSVSGSNASFLTVNAESGLTDERRFVPSSNFSAVDGGANSNYSLDLSDTGVSPGTYLNATLTVDGKGRISNASSGISGGADVSASYVVLGLTGSLPNERQLSASTGLLLTDGGPGSTVSLRINDNVVATLTGSLFSGPVVAAGGLSGSLQRLSNGSPYLIAGHNTIITTQSNGQIVISERTSSLQVNYTFVSSSTQVNFSSSQYESLLSTTLSSDGHPVLVLINSNLTIDTGSAQFSVLVDGQPVQNALLKVGPISSASTHLATNIAYVHKPPPGLHTYAYAGLVSGTTSASINNRTDLSSIFLWELREVNHVTASTSTATPILTTQTFITGLSASIRVAKNPVLVLGTTTFVGTHKGNWSSFSVLRDGVQFYGHPTASIQDGGAIQVPQVVSANEAIPVPFAALDFNVSLSGTQQVHTYQAIAKDGGGFGGEGSSYNASGTFGTLILIELPNTNFKYIQQDGFRLTGSSYQNVTPTGSLRTSGNPVLLIANVNNNTSASAICGGGYTLTKNGTTLSTASHGMQAADGEGQHESLAPDFIQPNRPAPIFYVDATPSGTYSYGIQGKNLYGSVATGQHGPTSMFMWEIEHESSAIWIDGGNNRIKTTSSVAISGDENAYVDEKGSDVYFYVSGTINEQNTLRKRVALFGGDVVVSGGLRVGTSQIKTQNNDLVFFDVNNPSGYTLTQLALTGTSTISQTGTGGSFSRRILPDINDAAVWLLNEASGSRFYVNTGVSSSHVLTSSGPTTAYTGGRQFFGNVTELTSSGFLSSSQSRTMHPTGSINNVFTLSLWTYLRAYTTFGKFLFKSANPASWTSPFGTGLHLSDTRNGQWGFFHGGVGGSFFSPFTPSPNPFGRIPLNEWTHIGMTYDGTSMKGYCNGVLVISASRNVDTAWGTPDPDGGDWSVGGNPQATTEYIDGFVTDARVAFGIARNQQWFADTYANGSPYFTGSIGTFITSQSYTADGWITVFDKDFSTEPLFTASQGSNTIGGVTWQLINSASASFVGVAPGEGLVIDPNALSSDYFLTRHDAPALYLTMSNLVPDFNWADYEVRAIWSHTSNADANFEFARMGFERTNWTSSSNHATTFTRGFNGSLLQAPTFWSGSSEVFPGFITSSHNIAAIHLRDPLQYDYYSTSGSLGTLPATLGQMTPCGVVRNAGGPNTIFHIPIWSSGSSFCFFFAAPPVNTSNNFRASIRRLRFDVFDKRKRFITTSLGMVTPAVDGWNTAADINFSTLATYTASSGIQTIAGLPWEIENLSAADFIGIAAGDGFRIDPNASNTDNYLTTRTAPIAKLKLVDVIPSFGLMKDVRVWAQWEVSGSNADFEISTVSLERTIWVSNRNYAFRSNKGFSTNISPTIHRTVQFLRDSIDTTVNDLTGSSGSNNVTLFHLKGVRSCAFFTGQSTAPYSSGNSVSWPASSSMAYLGEAHATPLGVFDWPVITGSGDISLVWSAYPVNTDNAFSASLQRLKIEYR